ncbi:EF-P 5-aminopentanol modification-associated protein YfmH [Streptococcus pseudoporcinus]|uniref:Peptidase, M16 family n=1 Tax=Streptococcus pseudoporcinus LQ 940-04 TaxID=875093 RepID=G5K7D6_9STRE|nr:pitrilysin family protein [Streptococcus pseudoporcinus]EFR45200.1 peptidase M16 inactive domain protein [Streptococcus pseudoporcinus SPIN 20026]EHI65434.1 peptidase, M16 family [Streptococcus pseudoporcinus LQ 940-04]VEF93857.1 protease [Streptococcus pseudoporcinus]
MTQLNKITYSRVSESVYQVEFKNGFQVFFIPKPMFTEKTAMLTVHYGSLDNAFTVRNRDYTYPEGLAHFLEHKVFEDERGQDVSQRFTQFGTEVNAFTTFDKTSYFISASNHFMESLTLLQEFVMSAHFTEASVEREKKIIAQEIDMYMDDPDYQSYIGILQNLFPDTYLSRDIAGSRQSIEAITVTDLEKNYKHFYHPSNMTLIVVGDINVEETFKSIENCQDRLKRRKPAKPTISPLPYHSVVKTGSISMDVSTPKLAVGFRGKKLPKGISLLEYKVGLRLLLSLLFGWTSKTYQTWYDDGKIDDSFDIEIEIQADFSFILITLDTNEPIAMSSNIRRKIKDFMKSKDINQDHLTLLKKEMFGDFVQSLDFMDQFVSQFNLYLSAQDSYMDIPQIIEKINFEEILLIGHDFFESAEISDFTVFPK